MTEHAGRDTQVVADLRAQVWALENEKQRLDAQLDAANRDREGVRTELSLQLVRAGKNLFS
jgi:hypothetical protein